MIYTLNHRLSGWVIDDLILSALIEIERKDEEDYTDE